MSRLFDHCQLRKARPTNQSTDVGVQVLGRQVGSMLGCEVSMSKDENKALVREHYRAFHSGDVEAIARQVAPDFIDHDAPPGSGRGPEFVKQWMDTIHRVFPDLQVTIEDIIAESDRV